MQKQSLEKTISRYALARSLFLVFGLSIVLIAVAAIFVQSQINKRHIAYVDSFIFDFNDSLESLQQQVNNLAKNDLIINSIIDDSNREAYLPVFFHSLELTVTENVAILFTDFSGEIITGKNVSLYLENVDQFDWKPSVLEEAKRYLEYSEKGIMIAAPILFSNYAEGAIVTYVKSLQSAASHTFDENLIVLVGADNQVLFSSDQRQAALGSKFNDFNTDNWYVHQKTFGLNQVISLEPFTSAYNDMIWLVLFMFIALVAVFVGSFYSTRLSSRMAADMLGKLQQSISAVASGTGIHTNSLPIENEPKEFEAIRKSYDDAVRDLARTAISRDRFENVINSLDEVLMVIDSGGDLILSNRSLDQFLEETGYTLPNDLESILPFDFINNSKNETSIIECIYDPVKGNVKNGQLCEIKWTRSDYLNECGDVLGAVVIGINITESKRLESELLLKNKVIDEAQTSIIIADAQQKDYRVTYVNKAFETLTGYPAEDVLGQNCRFLQGKDTDLDTIKEISEALSSKQPTTVTLLNYKKDGTPFYNQLTLNPVFNEKGIVTHILGLQVDVTEQENAARYNKQAKIKAEESEKLKSDFLASMSHEIRTPMNGIMGMLSLLLGSDLNEKQMRHASLASSSADSLLTIINDILDFSKIEAGKLDIEPIEFDLVSQLGEIVDSIAGKEHKKGVEVILDTAGIEMQVVVGDPGRIRQILTNLLGNAIKFTHEGRIVVRALLVKQTDDLFFTCSVQDNGIGIEPERLPLIFDSFTQADASTTRKFGGTGLGLAICKQLVELMGGDMSVESTPGLGSTFSFNLRLGKASQSFRKVFPLGIEHSRVSTSSDRDSESKRNNTRELMHKVQPEVDAVARVLLVEDNYTNQVLAEALLNNMGYSVDIVGDGEQALAILNATSAMQQYQLILMDCQMPVMDGFEATQKIRKGEASDVYQSIPIIAMTANAIKGDKEKCLNAGMSDYVSKPVNPDILQDKLAMWMPAVDVKYNAELESLTTLSALDQSCISWNQDECLSRLRDNEAVLKKIIEVFLVDMPVLVEELNAAITNQEFARILSTAHTLKGCCANISAHELTRLIIAIELAVQEKNVHKLNALWSQFEAEQNVLFDLLQVFKEQEAT
jgi:PAS domain S-box-containing protein